MAKRFTATEKWEDSWFRRLRPPQKLLWLYMLDRCDIAGILDVDLELASFCIGAKVGLDGFEARVRPVSGSRVWIPKFIQFQYGCTVEDLDESSPVHRGVMKQLKRYGLFSDGQLPQAVPDTLPIGYARGIETPKDKNKDKDKEKEKTKENVPRDLETVRALFAERHYPPSEAENFWNYYESNGWKVGKNPMKDWKAAAANWNKNRREWNGRASSPPDPGPRKRRCEKCGKDFDTRLTLCPDCYPNEPTAPPPQVKKMIESLGHVMSVK